MRHGALQRRADVHPPALRVDGPLNVDAILTVYGGVTEPYSSEHGLDERAARGYEVAFGDSSRGLARYRERTTQLDPSLSLVHDKERFALELALDRAENGDPICDGLFLLAPRRRRLRPRR